MDTVISQNNLFDSMKNLIRAMKNKNITHSLKASVFYLDENLQVVAFGGLGEDYHSSLATEKLCFSG